MNIREFLVPEPSTTGRAYISLPRGATILSVGEQRGRMFVWALVNQNATPAIHCLIVMETGPDVRLPTGAEFVGTVEVAGRVWHVWDAGDEKEEITARIVPWPGEEKL